MTRTEILRAIESVAREHLKLEGRLTQDLRFAEDLRLDSVQLLTLAVEVENRLQVALDPEDDAAITTVGDLVEAVWRRSGDGG